MPRTQSPSSIDTFKQCPRRYYYAYIAKLSQTQNIHCLRGNIVHNALEHFFDIDTANINANNFISCLSSHLKNLFEDAWNKSSNKLQKLDLGEEKLQFYYEDSLTMLANWLNTNINLIQKKIPQSSFNEAFETLKPAFREQHFSSSKYKVRGFIDAIHIDGNNVKVLDYKTSKSPDFKPSYKLQLGIYALLYEEKFGKLPDEVGLWVLKHREMKIPVTEDLVKHAKFEIEQIHLNTETDDIKDYPRNPGPLCKYSTGQCNFYDVCFGLKTLEEAKKKKD
ncbi:MAG: PD-(D/E)XK nuclease family protein [Nanoarchaeota archaeon]|nr:PD-(D/E)XK nuclease family protein [Nanoarchaeota archaeon]